MIHFNLRSPFLRAGDVLTSEKPKTEYIRFGGASLVFFFLFFKSYLALFLHFGGILSFIIGAIISVCLSEFG